MILHVINQASMPLYRTEAFSVSFCLKRTLRKIDRKIVVETIKNGDTRFKISYRGDYNKETAIVKALFATCKQLIRYGYNLKLEII